MSCTDSKFQGDISEHGVIIGGSKFRIEGDRFAKDPRNDLKELSKHWFYYLKLSQYPGIIFLMDISYAGTVNIISDMGNSISFSNIKGQRVTIKCTPKEKLKDHFLIYDFKKQ
jgi:hypothetical protein